VTDRHADDERLSAYIDGQEPQLRPHLDGCPRCRARVAELRRVRDAVAAPLPPPPAADREAAIAAAIGGRGSGATPRGRQPVRWVAGAAAAALVLVGAAVGLSQLSSGQRTKQYATSGTPANAQASKAEAQTDGQNLAAHDQLGDLGAINDSAALRAAVQPTVARFDTAGGAAQQPAPSSANSTNASRALGDAKVAAGCDAAAKALDPANVTPAASGTVTWQGTPAVVLVYDVAGRQGTARVYVLARDGCRLLEFQSYAP
jgi:hypothetical protein